jgi:pyruvate kinase
VRRQRNTKILATLGPASNDEAAITALFEAGADLFRINMSHTSHDDMRRYVKIIRVIEKKVDHPIGILVDLQGPKLRVGKLQGGSAPLKTGQAFTFDLTGALGNNERVTLPHPEIFEAVEDGTALLIDDGKIKVVVEEHSPTHIKTRVLVGGTLKDKKGVNVPDVVLPISAMTEKDLADLEVAVAANIDWIALSFVQRAADIVTAQRKVAGRAGVLAKIEKPAALKELHNIVLEADALMVARGDLGVELPLEMVPGRQKEILRQARRAGKPVVVATQMLESMITSPVPTRAEVSDVATAVFEGADAVMLSAESAAGDFPVDAVKTMDSIARTVEGEAVFRSTVKAVNHELEPTAADAITAAANQVAKTLNASAIVCYTSTGSTALRASRDRPSTPILALTPILKTARRLSIAWGLTCVLTDDAQDLDDMVDRACRIAFKEKFATLGKRIVITAGLPFGTPGKTNLLRIAMVGTDQQ